MKNSIPARHASYLRATSPLVLLALVVLSCKHDATAPVIAANGFVSISAGGGHTCALTASGAAYCWGNNNTAQLGDSTSVQNRATPTLVAGGHMFIAITAGLGHTCALTAAGAAFCWGANESGELGDGTTTERHVPTSIAGLTFASIVTGARSLHTCGITTGGLTYCWGSNGSRQLGTAPADPPTSPGLVQGGLQFSSVSVGENHTCALTKQGAAYCWGDNNGELGIGTPNTNTAGVSAVQGGLTFSSIGASAMFTCGVATGGSAHCWGDNADGELGDGTPVVRTTPVAVLGGLTFASVTSSGGPHVCGLTAAGAAYCWGDGFYGELGDGTNTQSEETPVAVSGGLVFRTIVSGANHNCGLTATGVAYCWGDDGSGELGIGTLYSSSNVPAQVVAP